MSTLLKNMRWCKIRCIICRPDFYNLNSLKSLKTYIIVRIEASINENTKRPQTYTVLNLHNCIIKEIIN